MANPVVTEVWNGPEFGFDGGAGYSNRVFTIEGINTTVLQNPSDIFSINFGLSGLPKYMDAHTSLRNLFCAGVRIRPWPDVGDPLTSRQGLKLIYNYATPTASRPLGGIYVDISGSNGQILKNRWEQGADQNVLGKSIVVGFKADSTGKADKSVTFPAQIDPATIIPMDPSGKRYDSFEFPRESPNDIITICRTVNTANQDRSLRNQINSGPFLGYDPLCVFCRDVRSQKIFGCGWYPDHFVQQLVFEAAPDPSYWQDVGFFLDEHTGKPVICDITDGTNNGYVIVERNDTSFDVLGLPSDLLG